MVIIRLFSLVLAGLALTAAVALSTLWWKGPSPAAAAKKVPQEVVLVAARAIGPGTLLTPEDVRWEKRPASHVPAGSVLRQKGGEHAFLGAALRRTFRAGEPLASSALVEPGEPGFLPAALAPGMRAVSLALTPAEGDSRILDPGDRVDVVLTQVFSGRHVGPTRRTVGEIVLHNRKVIALGRQLVQGRARGPGNSGFARRGHRKVPQTITLEVTSRQAAELMVASRLGMLQLALRSAARNGAAGSRPRRDKAIWAAKVSPALRKLQRIEDGQTARTSATSADAAGAMALTVVRGTRFEWQCFDAQEQALPSCPARPLPPPEKGPKRPPPQASRARTAGAPAPQS